MTRFWVSWWSGNYADEGCTKPPFKFWTSGQRDRPNHGLNEAQLKIVAHMHDEDEYEEFLNEHSRDDWSICAVIDAVDEDAVWQLLTKRAPNIEKYLPADWGDGYDNVWLGVSVGDRKHGLPRIEHLCKVPAKVRFLSIEPLLEDLGELNLEGIGWVIVGGESGVGFRPMCIEWVRKIAYQCAVAGVPFFYKQSGGLDGGDSLLDGVEVKQWPMLVS